MQTTLGEVAGQTGPVQDLLRSRPEQCVLAAHGQQFDIMCTSSGHERTTWYGHVHMYVCAADQSVYIEHAL